MWQLQNVGVRVPTWVPRGKPKDDTLHLVLPVVGEEQPPRPAVAAEPVEGPELREVRVVLQMDGRERTADQRASQQTFETPVQLLVVHTP